MDSEGPASLRLREKPPTPIALAKSTHLCDNSPRPIPSVHPPTTASHKPFTMPGQLFTNYFLEEGILHTDAWKESLRQPKDLDSFRTRALAPARKGRQIPHN